MYGLYFCLDCFIVLGSNQHPLFGSSKDVKKLLIVCLYVFCCAYSCQKFILFVMIRISNIWKRLEMIHKSPMLQVAQYLLISSNYYFWIIIVAVKWCVKLGPRAFCETSRVDLYAAACHFMGSAPSLAHKKVKLGWCTSFSVFMAIIYRCLKRRMQIRWDASLMANNPNCFIFTYFNALHLICKCKAHNDLGQTKW